MEIEKIRSYVSFSISGLELNPDTVSELLEIEPDYLHRKGDVKKSSRSDNVVVHKDGHWSITSNLPPEESFEAHFDDLLDRLAGKEGDVKLLAKKYKAHFSCDIWEAIGIEVSSEIINRIAVLDASIGITFYS
jgi:hypothetical protein